MNENTGQLAPPRGMYIYMYTCDHAGFAPHEKKTTRWTKLKEELQQNPQITNYDNSMNYKLYKLLCG
jgi:hypothetical protein